MIALHRISELYRLQNGQLIADIESVNAEQLDGVRYSNEVYLLKFHSTTLINPMAFTKILTDSI